MERKMNFHFKTFLILLFCITKLQGKELKVDKKLSPVIFVPGDGGSQMDAKLNKPEVVHYICDKTSGWFNIWLNMELLVPLVIDCWIDNVKLYYNITTRTTRNSAGVETRIPGWGSSEVVEWIDPSHAKTGAYFKDIGNALMTLGYVRNISIRGAPYDFRKAPNENKQWFIDMKELIQDTYDLNENTPVTLITHSMGSPMTLLLLQQQSKEWKNKYLARVISLAGAWAGSVKAVKVYAMGDDLGAYALRGSVMRAQQITSPSLAWLLPSPLFWKSNEILVQSKTRNYTFSQLEDYFNDIDYRPGWEMRQDTIRYSDNFSPPDIELHCLYGSKIPTVENLVYKDSVVSTAQPTLKYGDGDGTVNARSLQACDHWRELQFPNISTVNLPGIDHMTILNNDRTIKYIVDILSQ